MEAAAAAREQGRRQENALGDEQEALRAAVWRQQLTAGAECV
ncbi:MAG: hypothetical protein ACRC25_10185 [Aeromonas hydrophila]